MNNKRPSWFLVVSFKTELLSEYIIHRGYRESLSYLLPKVGLLKNRMIIDNNVYVDLNELNEIQSIISSNIFKETNKVYSVIKKQSINLIKVANNISKKVHKIKSEDYVENLTLFFNEYQKTLALIGIPTIIDLTIENILKEILRESKIKNINEAYSILAVSEKIIETNKEKYDLLSISIRQKKGKDISKIIDKHINKYGWLHSTLLAGKLYTKNDILKEIELIINPESDFEKLKLERLYQIENADQVIKSIVSSSGKKIALLLQKSVYIRTARLEWLNQACYIIRPFLIKIAEQLKVSYEDLTYLLPEEIYSGLIKNDIRKDLILKRKAGYALISDEENYCLLLTDNELKNIKNKYSVNVEVKQIKGLVVCKGKTKGFVVIVKDRSEIDKVKDGDVLVTPLTTPDFIIGMKKSVAIITDLGGMTSHAAIVARELKKPCIVGTSNATQVLKDGDFVEVDADNGIVRIIK